MGAVLCFPTLTLLGAPTLTHQRVSNRVRGERPNPVIFYWRASTNLLPNSFQYPAVLSGFFVFERGVVFELL